MTDFSVVIYFIEQEGHGLIQGTMACLGSAVSLRGWQVLSARLDGL